jgi:hypothetical protein
MYLEINVIPFSQSSFHLLDSLVCMFIKYVKMCDSVPGEEGASHGTVEFPHIT